MYDTHQQAPQYSWTREFLARDVNVWLLCQRQSSDDGTFVPLYLISGRSELFVIYSLNMDECGRKQDDEAWSDMAHTTPQREKSTRSTIVSTLQKADNFPVKA